MRREGGTHRLEFFHVMLIVYTRIDHRTSLLILENEVVLFTRYCGMLTYTYLQITPTCVLLTDGNMTKYHKIPNPNPNRHCNPHRNPNVEGSCSPYLIHIESGTKYSYYIVLLTLNLGAVIPSSLVSPL